MAQKSNIQWTDATWNIARGCTKVDEDCKFCYMYRDSMDSTRYKPQNVVRTKTVFDLPLKYKGTKSECWEGRPLIFTSSLTDFFHEAIDGYRQEAWDIIRRCPHLIFQILTKRPERILDNLPPDWGEGWDNVWLGTSAGSGGDKQMQRIKDLMRVKLSGKAKIIFLSLEPLHGEVDLEEAYEFSHQDRRVEILSIVDWVIVGGESGNDTGKYRYRPCKLEWITSIANACEQKGVPVFIKQMGTHLSKEMGLHDRHGGDVEEFPYLLQTREFPALKEVV